MNHPLTGSIERACGVKTNGIGKTTTAHLNLTRTLADIDAEQARQRQKKPEPVTNPRQAPYAPRSQSKKIPYAGKDK